MEQNRDEHSILSVTNPCQIPLDKPKQFESTHGYLNDDILHQCRSCHDDMEWKTNK